MYYQDISAGDKAKKKTPPLPFMMKLLTLLGVIMVLMIEVSTGALYVIITV